MRKNMYEIIEELKKVSTREETLTILANHWTKTLATVLEYTYNPNYKWRYNSIPASYKKPEDIQGLAHSTLDVEIRRLYLFLEGNPTADKLTTKKREELFVSLLESLEPKEADVVISIFNHDLGVKMINHKFIKDNIPGLLA